MVKENHGYIKTKGSRLKGAVGLITITRGETSFGVK